MGRTSEDEGGSVTTDGFRGSSAEKVHSALEGMGTSIRYFIWAASCQQLFCCFVFFKKKNLSVLDVCLVFASNSNRRVMVLFATLSMHFFSF